MSNLLLIGLLSKEDICKEIGKRIKHCRIWKNMTQEELAQKCGLSRKTIVNIESGSATLDSVVAVAMALDMTNQLKDIFTPNPSSIEEVTGLSASEHMQRPSPKKKVKI